jgi:hypothetical protein
MTYTAQLAARAAKLLPGTSTVERLELLGFMDEDDMRASLAWLAAAHPEIFDHSLVRDQAMVGRLLKSLPSGLLPVREDIVNRSRT